MSPDIASEKGQIVTFEEYPSPFAFGERQEHGSVRRVLPCRNLCHMVQKVSAHLFCIVLSLIGREQEVKMSLAGQDEQVDVPNQYNFYSEIRHTHRNSVGTTGLVHSMTLVSDKAETGSLTIGNMGDELWRWWRGTC